MWKVLSCLHRTARGSLRAPVREDQQGFSLRSLTSECGSNVKPKVPHFVVTALGSVQTEGRCGGPADRCGGLADRCGGPADRCVVRVNNTAIITQHTRHRFHQEHDQGGYENWTFFEALQYTTALVLIYNIVHFEKNEFPSWTCPVLNIKNHKSIYAQPVSSSQVREHYSALSIQHDREDSDESLALSHQVPHLSPPHVELHHVLQHDASCLAAQLEEHLYVKEEFEPSSLNQKSLELTQSKIEESGCEPSNKESLLSNNKEFCKFSENLTCKKEAGKSVRFAESEFELELSAIDGIELLEAGNPRGVTILQELSSAGSSVASFHLGMAYESGFLVKQNITKARKYYEKSARAGNPDAEYNLAVFYIHGHGGLQPDHAKARQLIEKAARGGSDAAIAALSKKKPSAASDDLSFAEAKHLYDLGRSFEDVGEMNAALEFYILASDKGYGKAREARQRLNSGSGSA